MISAVIGCAVAIVVVVIAIGSRAGGRADALERRLARLEAKLDEIARHVGAHFDEAAWRRDEVSRLEADGRKIDAIRAHRQQHPELGLREAKEFVDSLPQGPNN